MMTVTETRVLKLRIYGIDDLDPIAVYLEDFGPGQGKVVLTCSDDSWSRYWSHMGEKTDIRAFLLEAGEHYLVRKFAPGLDPTETDYDSIVDHTRSKILGMRQLGELSKEQARKYWDEAEGLADIADNNLLQEHYGELLWDVFGDEWWYCLPTQPNYKYEYLVHIINTVKVALMMLPGREGK